MKKIILLVILVCFNTGSLAEDTCHTLYEDETIKLCAVPDPDLDLGPAPAYEIHAINKKEKKGFIIDDEIDLDGVKNTKKLSNGLYFYKAYPGGNCANCENRHVLFIVTDDQIRKAGEFAGYEDIDNDGKMDFFTYATSKAGKSHADEEYVKVKMIINNNKLIQENKNHTTTQ